MERVGDFAAVRRLTGDVVGPVGLVPTMGYLHEGHTSLLEGARANCAAVVMSLYVNPLQFDDADDLARYPRDPERDLELALEAGVDVVFAPDDEEMYPAPPSIHVGAGTMADTMEGARRPGHFDGVAMAVTKLLAGLQPDRAYFGKKDGQQLAIVTRLVEDLSLPVEVVGMPTVREVDGLALSSRNVLLGADARAAATRLSQGLFAAADAVEAGERSGPALEALAAAPGAADQRVSIEYVELASQRDVGRLPRLDRPSFLAIAAAIDGVRLIDNLAFDGNGVFPTVDRGIRLDRPSVLYSREEM